MLIGYDETDVVETSRESRSDISNLKVVCSAFYPHGTFINAIACKHL
jgi:hypothetical protein